MKLKTVIAAGLTLAMAMPVFAQQGQGGQGRQGRRGGFGRQGFGGRGGGQMGLLMMEEVQKELKVDAAQLDLIKQIGAEARNRNQSRGNFQDFQSLTPEQREQRIAEFRKAQEAATAETDKKIAEVLEPAQVKRLKELEVQRAGIRALARPEVATALKLSADQQAKVKAAMDAEREATRSLFQGFRGNNGQRPTQEQIEEIRKKGEEARSQADAKLNAVLTDAQKKQFQGMQGAPFTFPQNGFGGGGGRRRRGGNNNPA